MKLMIASDLHGSAFYCRQLLAAMEREQPDKLLLLGGIFCTTVPATICRRAMPPKR